MDNNLEELINVKRKNKLSLGKRSVLSNLMKVVDEYVQISGWTVTNSLEEVSFDCLAQSLNNIRKVIIDVKDIKNIVYGYLFHF